MDVFTPYPPFVDEIVSRNFFFGEEYDKKENLKKVLNNKNNHIRRGRYLKGKKASFG
jgi:hypothetical protein